MNESISDILMTNQRGNVRYVFPGENTETLAKMIATLANTKMGGKILLGFQDRGNIIECKGFSFPLPKREEIVDFLDGFAGFEIFDASYYKQRIAVINVPPSFEKIAFSKNKFYKFDSNYTNELSEKKPVKLFISYNHEVSEIADFIETKMKQLFHYDLIITRDTSLVYKDDIDKFMLSIKKHDIVLSLISNSYLESDACMYEISELMKDSEYSKRLAFIVLTEKDNELLEKPISIEKLVPSIYSDNRFKYVTFWNDKIDYYQSVLKDTKHHPETSLEIIDTLRRITNIANNIGEFVSMLNKTMGKSLFDMIDDDFSDIANMIKKYVD